ncbi:MAG: PEP-CTERM sorting domain-containing protein [Roseibacillus sp.]
MISKALPIVFASASFTALSHGVILVDTFDGGLNKAIWDETPFIENNGEISPTNDRLEFTASPANDLIGANHYASYASYNVLTANQGWCVDVLAYLSPTEDFGKFSANEAVSIYISIENTNNSQDNLEISLTAGDPLGTGTSDKLIRAGLTNDGTETTPLIAGMLGSIGATDLKVSFDPNTNLATISYDTGSGAVVLGDHDLSAWDFDEDKNLTFSLGGGAFSTDGTLQSGTVEVNSGQAFFDNLTIDNNKVPEPSTIALGTLGLLALLRRKR